MSQVSNSTGDMRAVLNACVAALDELVAEASSPPGPAPPEGASEQAPDSADAPAVPTHSGAHASPEGPGMCHIGSALCHAASICSKCILQGGTVAHIWPG